jgi:hypothetical protein
MTKLLTMPSLLVALAPLSALVTLAAVTSCADSEDAHARDEDASTIIQPPDAGSDVVEAGRLPCDAGDPSCVSDLLSCAEADFCPTPTAIEARYVFTSVWGSGANDVWAIGSGGTIRRWDGAVWNAVDGGTLETLNAVWGAGPNDVWIAGSSASVLHGPTTWKQEPVFTSGTAFHGRMHAIWGSAANDVRIGGQPFSTFDETLGSVGGNSLRWQAPSADGGVPFELLGGVDGRWADATVRAIWGTSARDIWLSLDNAMMEPWARGVLVHGAGDPLTWTSIDSQANVPLESIWGASASDVWAVGANGTIRRHTTGSKRWAIVDDAPTTASLHAVWGTAANDVWIVGDAGTILHFDGTNWREATVALPLGRKPNLTGVWGSGPNDVWVVGEAFALHFTGRKAP